MAARERARYYTGMTVRALLPLAALVLVACGSSSAADSKPSFPEASLTSLSSDSGKLSIAVRTWPTQPPELGNVSVQLSVQDESAAPVSGLALDVVPWMPAMGHGTSVVPTVSESAPGVYQLDNVVLYMPGTWQVRTTFDGALSDHVEPTFDIQ